MQFKPHDFGVYHRCDNKDTVAHLAPSSGHCKAFSSTIPPLQVALSFACSVASLSHSPSFQLPGWHGLRHGSLADYLLGWGRTSTCIAGHTKLQYTSKSKHPYGLQEFPPHNVKIPAGPLEHQQTLPTTHVCNAFTVQACGVNECG